jgi:hypothetical protein
MLLLFLMFNLASSYTPLSHSYNMLFAWTFALSIPPSTARCCRTVCLRELYFGTQGLTAKALVFLFFFSAGHLVCCSSCGLFFATTYVVFLVIESHVPISLGVVTDKSSTQRKNTLWRRGLDANPKDESLCHKRAS